MERWSSLRVAPRSKLNRDSVPVVATPVMNPALSQREIVKVASPESLALRLVCLLIILLDQDSPFVLASR